MTQEVHFVWIICISIPFSSTLTNWLKAVSYHCFFSAFSVSSICFCLHVTGRSFPLLLFSLRFHFIGDLTFSRCVPWTWFSVSGWYVVLIFFFYCLLFVVPGARFRLPCWPPLLSNHVHSYLFYWQAIPGNPSAAFVSQFIFLLLSRFLSCFFFLVVLLFLFLLLLLLFSVYNLFLFIVLQVLSFVFVFFLFTIFSFLFLAFYWYSLSTCTSSISYQKSEYFLIYFCTFNPFE